MIPRDPRDPPVPADGNCVNCGGERRTPKTRREPHTSTATGDPFCSSECARAWYGVALPSARYSVGLGGSNGERRGGGGVPAE